MNRNTGNITPNTTKTDNGQLHRSQLKCLLSPKQLDKKKLKLAFLFNVKLFNNNNINNSGVKTNASVQN